MGGVLSQAGEGAVVLMLGWVWRSMAGKNTGSQMPTESQRGFAGKGILRLAAASNTDP